MQINLVCKMEGFADQMLLLSLVFISAVSVLTYKLGTRNHDYYKKRGIHYVKPVPFLGNLWPIFFKGMSQCDLILWLYNELQGHKFGGIFGFMTPSVFVRDPDVIRNVCVKDFEFFRDRKPLLSEETDPLAGKVLPSLTGERWRAMRCVMSSAFTANRVKEMHQDAVRCVEDYVHFLLQQVESGCNHSHIQILAGDGFIEVEMRDIVSRYCTDVLATCTLGLKVNSCTHPHNNLYTMGKALSNFEGRAALVIFGYLLSSKLMKLMNINIVDRKAINYFKELVHRLKKEKRTDTQDVLQVLLGAQETPGKLPESDRDDDVVTAQIMLVFLAGIETITTLLCFALHLIAINPQVQDKLFQEIQEYGSDFQDWETLHKLQYMDMVISETLRLYPPVEVVDRKCVKACNLGECGPVLQEGDGLVIPIYALHRDPEHFPEPERFIPERFSGDNKQNIKPFTYLPFGAGPRGCLGIKFARTVAKLALVNLLKKFKLQDVGKTKIPLRLAKFCFNKRVEGGFWLGMKPR